MEQTGNKNKSSVLKMTDLTTLYKTSITDIVGKSPNRIHTTKLKNRLLSHFESLTEFKEGKKMFLVFDNAIRSTKKAVYENMYHSDGLILKR